MSLISFAMRGCKPGRHALTMESVCASCMQSVVLQLAYVEGEELETESLKKYSCALAAATMLRPSVLPKENVKLHTNLKREINVADT